MHNYTTRLNQGQTDSKYNKIFAFKIYSKEDINTKESD